MVTYQLFRLFSGGQRMLRICHKNVFLKLPLVWTLASLSSILIFLSLLSSTRLASAEHSFSLRSRGVRGQGELGSDMDLRWSCKYVQLFMQVFCKIRKLNLLWQRSRTKSRSENYFHGDSSWGSLDVLLITSWLQWSADGGSGSFGHCVLVEWLESLKHLFLFTI